MSIAVAIGLLALSPVASGAEEEKDYHQSVPREWSRVRLVNQKIDVSMRRLSAGFTGSYVLEAKDAASGAVFGFRSEPKAAELKASCDGQLLVEIPFLDLPFSADRYPFRKKSEAEEREEARKKKGQEINACLSRTTGLALWESSRNPWLAWELDFDPGQKRTVKVEASLKPVQLADSAKDGPCYAFTIPIRLGRVWARPAGKLEVTVTLGDDVKPEDVILVRPTEVKRDGRKLTLSLDGEEPVEDFIVVLKGKLPEEPKPPEKPEAPKPPQRPVEAPAPPGPPEAPKPPEVF